VENRRPLVRAANTGISAFVDAAGRVTASLEVERIGWLQAIVHPRSGRSVYHLCGDAFAILCLGAVVTLLGLALFRRHRSGITKRREEA
jgi:apolipoprotein N-acyltransferase